MKLIQSKILLSLLLITTSRLHGMDDDSTSEHPRPNVEYAYINLTNTLYGYAAHVRDSIITRGIENVPRSDFDDVQQIYQWIQQHNDVTSRNGVHHVPKITLTKILNRLYQLRDIYCPKDQFSTKEFFIDDTPEWLSENGYFHKEINFSTPKGSQGSNNLTDQLFKLVQNRLVIAGGVVVAAAAAWYWFYYQHEPKTQEIDDNETAYQPEVIEDTK